LNTEIFRILLKRGDAVYREVTRSLADDKVMSKKEKEERVLWKKNEVADVSEILMGF
jgi:hypothetical protein